MSSAVCVDKALGIYMVPKSKSGNYDPSMYKNVSETQASVNCFAKTTFVWTLWEYVEKVVWVMRCVNI